MSGLTTGNGYLPPGWGYPSPIYIGGEYKSGGMLWVGKEEVTQSDIDALYDALGGTPQIDQGTIVGLHSWRWTSFATRNSDIAPLGGIGSQAYEYQHVGEGQGANFAKKEIWYTNSDGALVKGIPPEAGCYHYVDVGDGYMDAHEGPEPGSPAEKARGKGKFYWDDRRKLYDIKF